MIAYKAPRWSALFRKLRRSFSIPLIRVIQYDPAAIGVIEQVAVAKLLDVLIQWNFKCDKHVKYILAVSSQRIYLLKLLRARGLPVLYLKRICYSIIIVRLIYSISVWGGFLSAESRGALMLSCVACSAMDRHPRYYIQRTFSLMRTKHYSPKSCVPVT